MTKAQHESKQDRGLIELAHHQTAATVLETAREYLDDKRVKRSLGHYAVELSEVAAMAEVPTITHGRVQLLPDYQDRDVFAFAVLDENEAVRNNMVELMPKQERVFMRRALELDPSGALAVLIDSEQLLVLGKTDVGATWGFPAAWEGHKGFYCATRPFIAVKSTDIPHMAITAIHEFSHVYDSITQPLSASPRADIALETELKAYAIEERVASFMGLQTDTVSGSVAALRQRHNGAFMGDGAFRTTDAIRAALMRNDLGHILKF